MATRECMFAVGRRMAGETRLAIAVLAVLAFHASLTHDAVRAQTDIQFGTELDRGQGNTVARQPQPAQGATSELADWPRPQAVLVVTGRQHGYIEPCGCTGLENAKGGLSRRHTFIRNLQAKGWPVVPLDVGNQVRRFGRQAEIKFQTTIDILRRLKYQGVGFGPDDLRLSVGELIASVAEPDGGAPMFLCANVDVLEQNGKFRVIQAGPLKIGITSVLGVAEMRMVNSPDITITDPVAALKQVVPQLVSQKCHHYVLMAHASIEESKEMSRQFPQFNIVVTAGGAGEPTREPERIAGSNAQLIQVGTKGMYVGVVGLYNGKPPQYARVVLDARYGDSQEVLDLFAGYQDQLETLGLDGLGVSPVPFTGNPARKFVGTAICADCHSSAMEVFEKSDHAHATRSISQPTQRSAIPRHFDPECISCHVTGWNAQGYFPYQSGYLGLEKTPDLLDNGCENCHGPGSRHSAAETGDVVVTEADKQRFRNEMKLPMAQARDKCLECHDLDNSPEFHEEGAFEKFWADVKHEGKY
ncbi:MAG: multiheme c-type cytochrome [Pirellulaceae bacterium]